METVEIPQLQFLDKLFVGFGVLQYIDKVGKIHDLLREGESGSRVAPWTLDIISTSSLFCQTLTPVFMRTVNGDFWTNFRRFPREGELGSGGQGPRAVRTWKSGHALRMTG